MSGHLGHSALSHAEEVQKAGPETALRQAPLNRLGMRTMRLKKCRPAMSMCAQVHNLLTY